MKTLDLVQGSEEWKRARLGVVTASEISALITPEWKVRTGDGPKTYLYEKASERIMGYSQDDADGAFGSFAVNQGVVVEKICLPWYEFTFDTKVFRPGFIVTDDGRCGCSPDAIVNDDLGLEIKCPQGPAMIRYVVEGIVPKTYLPQIQFSMYVTGKPAWEFVAFHRHITPLVIRVPSDPTAQAAIATALASFLPQLDAAEAKVRALMPRGGRAEA